MPLAFKDILAPAANAVGAGLGLLLEGHEDRRQLRQQEKLQNLQIKGQQSMGIFNQDLAKQMWDYTNYENQKKHLQAAGLNPGLMYGMGGGGGVTANTPTGNVNGADAPKGSGQEPLIGAGMGMQLAAQLELLKAQKENIQADTANKEAQATKTAGVDTQVAQNSIEQIKASTTNTQAQTSLTNVQTALTQIEKDVQTDIADKGYRQGALEASIDKLNNEVIQIKNSNWTFNQTKEDIVKTIKQEAINKVIEGELKKSGIQINAAQINKLTADIMQRGKEIDIKQFEATIKANYPQIGNVSGAILNSIKSAIDKINSFDKDYTQPNQIK